LLQHQIFQPVIDHPGIVFLFALGLVGVAGAKEGQETKRRRGNVIVLRLARAVALAVAVEVRKGPVSIRCLVRGQPLQPLLDGRLGGLIPATILEQLFLCLASASVQTSRLVLGSFPLIFPLDWRSDEQSITQREEHEETQSDQSAG
jgi:hypothetical protein